MASSIDPRFQQGLSWLRASAHPTRLAVLAALREQPRCVLEIRDLLDVPQPNLSQHLAVLRRSGLVGCRAVGNLRCYYLARPTLVRGLIDLLEADHPVAPAPEYHPQCIRDAGPA